MRVKTPSYPLTVCRSHTSELETAELREIEPGRLDLISGDQWVGFVLSEEQASKGASLYRSLME